MKRGNLVGITGYARSGKDTLASYLRDNHGYVKVAFAHPLVNICLDCNKILFLGGIIPIGFRTLVNLVGYERAKKFKAFRKHLQEMGMIFRDHLGEDVFVRAAMDRATVLRNEGKSVAITDVRFENEVDAILREDGYLVHIVRPGVGPVNDHVSDKGEAFERADCIVRNDTAAEDLSGVTELIDQDASRVNNGDLLRLLPGEAEATSGFE